MDTVYKIPEVRVYLKETRAPYEDYSIASVDAATLFARRILADLDREQLILVTFNTKNNPINWHTVSIGGLDSTSADIKSIMKVALLSNASNIMLFHNHPSGNPTPSPMDKAFTQKLDKACNLMNLRLLDHIIIAGDKSYSMLQHKDFNDK